MPDDKAQRGFFERSQLAITVATGLIGLWLSVSQHSLAKRQAEIKEAQDAINVRLSTLKSDWETVESVSKYFDLLSGQDTTKAKMGAYAVYMLKRDDPEMVVSLVMAADKPSLRNSVLTDLANRDPRIRAQLVAIMAPRPAAGGDDAAPQQQTVAAAALAEEVLSQVTREAWAYVGILRGGRWAHGPMFALEPRLPKAGEELQVGVRSVYMRETAPDSATYRHGAILGVLNAGQRVRVLEVRPHLKGDRVWIRFGVVGEAR